MKLPEKSIEFELFGKQRTVPLPNNGMLEQMERMKIEVSGNTHKSMLFGQSREALYNYVMIDAKVSFECLIPELKNELGVKTLNELDIIQTKELVKRYQKDISPWLNSIYDFLNEVEEELQEKEEKDQKDESEK